MKYDICVYVDNSVEMGDFSCKTSKKATRIPHLRQFMYLARCDAKILMQSIMLCEAIAVDTNCLRYRNETIKGDMYNVGI